jgi:cation diffusion facilitator family transporter
MAASPPLRLQTLVLITGAVLMGIKLMAWRVTGSNTILGDALESVVNLVAGGFALYSLTLAAKPRDPDHPYGHGKVEFISAGLEGGMVIMAGALIIWRSVQALRTEQVVSELGTGMLLTAGAGAVNLMMGLVLMKRGRHLGSITLEASGTHLLSDAWSSAAMVIGLLAIQLTGLLWLDPVFAILFAVYIIFSGARVFRRSVAGIMDETDTELAEQVLARLEAARREPWVDVHNFRMTKFGAMLHIDCHVTMPWYYTLEASHAEVEHIAAVVGDMDHRRVELFIHTDPCLPTSCAICRMAACPARQHPFERAVVWTLESVHDNIKHGLPVPDRAPRAAGG